MCAIIWIAAMRINTYCRYLCKEYVYYIYVYITVYFKLVADLFACTQYTAFKAVDTIRFDFNEGSTHL